MKLLLVLLSFFLLLPIHLSTQTRKESQTTFLSELNDVLKNSKDQHWKYPGEMTIDSAFAINKKGIMSVTVRYKTDSSFVRVRMEAPINRVKKVAYDLYLILQYDQNEVTVFESENGSEELKEQLKTDLFHIGVSLNNGFYEQEKLRKLLKNLQKFH